MPIKNLKNGCNDELTGVPERARKPLLFQSLSHFFVISNPQAAQINPQTGTVIKFRNTLPGGAALIPDATDGPVLGPNPGISPAGSEQYSTQYLAGFQNFSAATQLPPVPSQPTSVNQTKPGCPNC